MQRFAYLLSLAAASAHEGHDHGDGMEEIACDASGDASYDEHIAEITEFCAGVLDGAATCPAACSQPMEVLEHHYEGCASRTEHAVFAQVEQTGKCHEGEDEHDGHDHGGGNAPCGCEKDEADHPFSINCADASAIRGNASVLSNCGTASEDKCKGALARGSPACQVAFFTLQVHHDYCDHDTLTTAEEELVHDWEPSCIECKIQRQYDAELVDCPEINCGDNEAALAAYGVLDASCTPGEAGSCCTSALTQGAFHTMIAYHDLCDHDDIPHEVELAVHDYEHSCEDHRCNDAGPGYDGTVCPSAVDALGDGESATSAAAIATRVAIAATFAYCL